jgi:mycothiol synthase
MKAFASRLYAGAADLQAMIDLLVAVRPASRITDYPGIVDLHELLGTPTVRANTRLWEDADGQLVGFACVDTYNNLWFEIAPRACGGGIESQMIAWGVERVRDVIQQHCEPITLDTSCRDEDTGRIVLLKQHGFVIQAVRSLHMIRLLDEPIPAPRVPAGFVVRHVAGEQEVEPFVALHRAAFGTEYMTVEGRLAMLRAPEYDPELDLVAVAPNGTFAANCMCSISQEENARTGRNEGYIDTVATHPAFQCQGLARALLLTGLHLLKQRGVETAVLGTSSENTAMQQAAASVGFRVQSTRVWFARQVQDIQAIERWPTG